MPECDVNEDALQLYWNSTSAWVFSYKLAAYSQDNFSQEHLCMAASESVYYITFSIRSRRLPVVFKKHVSKLQKSQENTFDGFVYKNDFIMSVFQ